MPAQPRKPALVARQQIDALCDEFEELWQAGARPDWKEFLGRVAESDQLTLARELVALDCDYRRERGEAPTVADYHSDTVGSPELADVVAAVLAAKQRDSAADASECESTQARLADTHSVQPPTPPNARADLPQIPGYDVLEFVAQGGMGVVYRARDKKLEREVALKLPRATYLANSQEKERFVREAVAAARVRHPNICPVFEVRETSGQPYIAMAFIRGVTLKAWRQAAVPKPRQVAEMMAAIARAVQAAHDQGLIHRDLKPSNVMVEDGSGEPMLMDFGLAKDLSSGDGLTVTGDVLGTPAYMAPEQAGGRLSEVGKHSDVYSLGAILYELLAGKAPFEGTLAELLHKVQQEDPPAPRQSNSLVHRDLETICLKAMAKRPAERYASAGAFADDLERFAQGEPILARPQSWLKRRLRVVQKHPVIAGLVVVIVLMAAVGGLAVPTIRQQVAISRLSGQLQASLQDRGWTPARLTEADGLAAELIKLSPDNEEMIRQPVIARLESYLQDYLARPRMEERDREPVETAIAALKSRAPEQAREWDEAAQRRFNRWEQTGELKPPFSGSHPLVPKLAANAGGTGLIMLDTAKAVEAADSADPADSPAGRLVETSQPGEENQRVEATVSVPAGGEFGVVFNFAEVQRGAVSAIAVSLDSQWFAVGSDTSEAVQIWDSDAIEPAFSVPGHPGGTIALAFGKESQILVSTGKDRILKVWDLKARSLLQSVQIDEPDKERPFLNAYLPLAIPKSGDRVYVGGRGAILCFALPDLKPLPAITPATWGYALSISDDGIRIASSNLLKKVTVWDTKTRQALWDLDVPSSLYVVIALSPDGSKLASSTPNHAARIHAADTGEVLQSLQAQESYIRALAFDPAGRMLAVGHEHAIFNLWDLPSGVTRATRNFQKIRATTLAYDPNGGRLFFGTFKGSLHQIDAASGQEQWTLANQSYDFALKRNTSGAATLTIRRNGTLLRDVEQPLGPGPAHLTARREHERLYLQVNQNPPVEFHDFFPPRAVTGGKLCLALTPGVELQELVVRRSLAAAEVSPLEIGDREMRASRFAAALEHFQDQLASADNQLTPEVQHEAQLKSAICLLKLNRDDEAFAALRELSATAGPATTYITVARFQLWVLLAERNMWSEADALSEIIQVQHPYDSIANLISVDMQWQIEYLYRRAINRRSLPFLAGSAQRLDTVVRIGEFLRVDVEEYGVTLLYEGFRLTGRDEQARVYGRKVFNSLLPELEQYGLPKDAQVYVSESWQDLGMIARWLKQTAPVEAALDKLLRSANGELLPEVRGQSWGLVLERARLHAARDEWEQAEKLLARAWAQREDAEFLIEDQVRTALLYGLALQRLGREKESQEAYRAMLGHPQVQARFKAVEDLTSPQVMELLALRGAARDFDEDFVEQLTSFAMIRIGGSAGMGKLLNQFPLTPELMKQMWTSRHGVQFSEEIAKGDLLLQEEIKRLMMLCAWQLVMNGAFDEPTGAEDELVWELARVGFDRFVANEFSLPTILQLALAWKGIPAPLGWKFVFTSVPADLKAPCAFVLARRFLRREQPLTAKDLLNLTLEYAGENQTLRKLAKDALEELAKP